MVDHSFETWVVSVHPIDHVTSVRPAKGSGARGIDLAGQLGREPQRMHVPLGRVLKQPRSQLPSLGMVLSSHQLHPTARDFKILRLLNVRLPHSP